MTPPRQDSPFQRRLSERAVSAAVAVDGEWAEMHVPSIVID